MDDNSKWIAESFLLMWVFLAVLVGLPVSIIAVSSAVDRLAYGKLDKPAYEWAEKCERKTKITNCFWGAADTRLCRFEDEDGDIGFVKPQKSPIEYENGAKVPRCVQN